MRYFVVGDVHGCAAQLETLVQLLPSLGGRQIVFLGDYVDVGPDSSGVLDILIRVRHEYPGAVFLAGNHDFYLQEYLEGGDFARYARQGGIPTIRSYVGEAYGDVLELLRSTIPRSHVDFLRSLQAHLETENFLFSHTGYDIDRPLDRSFETMVLATHRGLFSSSRRLEKTAVCGHYFQHTSEPFVEEGVICLDTGCGILDGPLTALLLPEYQLLQVNVDLEVDTANVVRGPGTKMTDSADAR